MLVCITGVHKPHDHDVVIRVKMFNDFSWLGNTVLVWVVFTTKFLGRGEQLQLYRQLFLGVCATFAQMVTRKLRGMPGVGAGRNYTLKIAHKKSSKVGLKNF